MDKKEGLFCLIKDLFVNMAMVISFVSLANQIIKKYDLNNLLPIKLKIIMGVVTGTLGIVLMIYSVNINQNTILDFRNISIAASAIYGGTIPAIICGAFILLFRIVYFGINAASIIAVVTAMIVTIVCIFIARLEISIFRKWIIATALHLITSSIALIIILNGQANLSKLLSIHWVATFIVSFITFRYIDYCLATNSLFRKLQVEATKDFLTGLNNVRNFDNLYNKAIKNAKENKEDLSLLMIDIDFFKKVNDTYGHANGDIVLFEVGKIIIENCRKFDIISRNGGEEFTALLLDCPKNRAIEIAERIRSNIEVYPFIIENGIKIDVTVSIGIANYPKNTNETEKLLELSDMALYTAKRTGRNKVCFYK